MAEASIIQLLTDGGIPAMFAALLVGLGSVAVARATARASEGATWSITAASAAIMT